MNLSLLAPISPVGRTSNSWHAIHLGVDINFEASSTHGSFTIHSWHCFHLETWMLKALQSTFTVVHAPCQDIHLIKNQFFFNVFFLLKEVVSHQPLVKCNWKR